MWQNEHWALSLSAAVLTMSEEEMGPIVVIPHVENGGCMKERVDLGPGTGSRD